MSNVAHLQAAPDMRARYAEAERFLQWQHQALVVNGHIFPRWISDTGAFWYERAGVAGAEYRIVNGEDGAELACITLADVMSAFAGLVGLEAAEGLCGSLPGARVTLAPLTVWFEAYGRRFQYIEERGVVEEAKPENARSHWLVSPDRRLAVFREADNLVIIDLATGKKRPVTQDGSLLHSYGAKPAAYRAVPAPPSPPEAIWSPCSRRLLTIRTDDRSVRTWPVVFYSGQEAGGRPLSIDIPTALPGDEHVTRYELLLIEADSGIVKRVERPPLHAVRMYDTPFSAGLAWWSADGERIYVADIERGEKSVEIIEVNGSSGAARSVFTEESVSYLELSVDVYGPTLARFLPATEELLWYSERSGNGHLYLYDLKSGRLKRQVTEGDWRVRSVLSVDEARRDVLLLAAGLKDGLDPYLRTPCVASLDYGVIRPLCDDDNDHIIWSHDDYALLVLAISGGDNRDISGVSPRGDRLIETVAKIGAFPRTVIRSRCGEVIAEVERATPKHLAQDWEWPIPFEAVAADGQTPIFGLLFKPPPALLSERTPIIDYIYGGPQLSFVPKSAFADPFSDFIFAVPAALSRLGFAVTVIDGRGSAYRDRKFREHSFGALERASDVDDHVAALNQLARQHPWIDLNRVGVTGFSGGGYGAALAAFRRPDVFKVAVACSGNYDQRLFWHSWGERYQGAQSVEQFSAQAASTYAAGLRGKILFIHGLLDSGCHPAGLFQLLQSLIEHNKDYDLFVMPNVAHEVPGIAERRRFDYFVRHLLNETPPTNVSIATDIDLWKPRLAAAMAARSGATS